MNSTKIILSLLSVIVFLSISCRELPTNPIDDYKNVSVSIHNPATIDTLIYGDSASIVFLLQNPHLITSITLRLNGKDSVFPCSFPEKRNDSLPVKLLFPTYGNHQLSFRAILSNRDSISGTKTFYIKGLKPQILSQSETAFLLRIGDSCTLQITASGSTPISYQWKKNNTINVKDTQPSLSIQSFGAADTGTYICSVTNSWGTVSSLPVKIFLKEQTKKAYWSLSIYRDTVYMGDSLTVPLAQLYTKTALIPVTIAKITTDTFSSFRGDSLFIFKTENLSPGAYSIISTIQNNNEIDTGRFLITVLSKQYTLNVQAKDSGSVQVLPVKTTYQYGDTVSLKAIAKSGFSFVGWSGIETLQSDSIKITIKNDLNIFANFAPLGESGNIDIQNTAHINDVIKTFSPSMQRPKTIVLAPGTYSVPKIKIYGKVKIQIQ